MMRELSLFSGAGGGLLGTHHLLGWETVGYVEFNDYCQRVIRVRIDDGLLSDAPIFGDIRAFIREGYAGAYQGMVDVISAGFPCQPFSVAGKQMGADDSRNMWPETIAVIRAVRPREVFLENVPGLISSGYIETVLDDLRDAGYQAAPILELAASDVGANHRRKRIWIRATVADAEPGRRNGGAGSQRERGGLEFEDGGWWSTEPGVGRVAYGVASRVDRLSALGNGQVPAVAAAAWRLLAGGE